MGPKVYVRPGKMGSIIGTIAGSGMLLFAVIFSVYVSGDDGSSIGLIFMSFWMLMMILIIAYYVFNLSSKKASRVAMAEIELDLQDIGSSLEGKLRSLERMKTEKLIADEEYLQKRK